MDRKIKAYKKIYRKAIEKTGLNNVDDRVEAYAVRLSKMYASDDFRKHNVYPSTSTLHVYAVIAMCLELKQFGFSDTDIMDYINAGFEGRAETPSLWSRAIYCLWNCYGQCNRNYLVWLCA